MLKVLLNLNQPTSHVHGPATAKAQSPTVIRRMAGTTGSPEEARRKRRRDAVSATGRSESVVSVCVDSCVGRRQRESV